MLPTILLRIPNHRIHISAGQVSKVLVGNYTLLCMHIKVPGSKFLAQALKMKFVECTVSTAQTMVLKYSDTTYGQLTWKVIPILCANSFAHTQGC